MTDAGRASALWDQGRHGEAIDIFRALFLVGQLDEAIRVLEPLSLDAADEDAVHDWLGRALATLHWQQRGPDAIAALPAPLRRLAETLLGHPAMVVTGEPVPPHDIAIPLMNLPWAFGTDLATIPGRISYFTPDPSAVAAWRHGLAHLPGLKVGLVWAGEQQKFDASAYRIDRRRSLKLTALAPLACVRGVSFVSLQKGAPYAAQPPPAQPPSAQPPPGIVPHDWTDELSDYADTAALIQALDLVISADTSPVHMAGALGRPVWLLNCTESCYRWLRDRDDNPWYPTLRQFRRTAQGDLSGVIDRVAAALMEHAA